MILIFSANIVPMRLHRPNEFTNIVVQFTRSKEARMTSKNLNTYLKKSSSLKFNMV